MSTNIKIQEIDRKKIVEGLSQVLAESYVLYLKTLNFHWNVTGPMFQPLHAVFEEQYTKLDEVMKFARTTYSHEERS
jgi:starvation-inducible DNA-binding protein